jgi:hypothetical protein
MPAFPRERTQSRFRPNRRFGIVAFLVVSSVGGCHGILDVDLPGQVPTGQLDDPTLASVLVGSAIGDFECAYNNYFAGSAVHSDEYESATPAGPLVFVNHYSERKVSEDEDDYVVGGCEDAFVSDGGSLFGIVTTMHTARFQSEDVYNRLKNWTDAQVKDRISLMATLRAYGGFTYTYMGETWCSVSFDGGPRQVPRAALVIAEGRFGEAITLAQQSGQTDIMNLARVGLARVEMDLEKWPEAAAAARQVPAGYEKFAGRGTESDRRLNKIFSLATQAGFYTIADAYLVMNDPRVRVVAPDPDAGNVWSTAKYPNAGSPIRIASYREAQLILAEALAMQGDAPSAMTIISGRRAELGLDLRTAGSSTEAVDIVIEERRRELSFEGADRLNDLLRKNIPWKVGSNKFGNPYGVTRCWPYPTKEVNGA